MSPKPGTGRNLAAAEKELAALNEDISWELKKAAVDIAGVVDPTPVSDLVGAGMSLFEGDIVGAGLSLISIIPYAGDALGKTAKGARAAKRLNALRKKAAALAAQIENLKKAEKTLGKTAKEAAERTAKGTKKLPKKRAKACSPCVQSPKLGIVSKGGRGKKPKWKQGWEKGQIPCFPPGTLVATPTGLRPIEDLNPGDEVKAYDFFSQRTYTCSILATNRGSTDCWINVETENEIFATTRNHPIWVKSTGTWTPAALLNPGAELSLLDGNKTVITKVIECSNNEPQITYNLTVSGLNNFFVGQRGILVHNNNSRLNRPGYKNYVLVDRNGKVYYSGMFGPNQTRQDVERRHSANRNRFDRSKKDRLVVTRGTRTYGEARRLEHENAVKHGTYIGRSSDKNFRGNRQYPMSHKKFKKYYPPNAC